MSLLSVIVPVYNEEKYLRECLNSICEQSLSDIEIILVDDGSTDSSGAICDEYAQKDKRIIVFHKENQGMLAARFSGLEISSGKYISFVDSDDWIDTDLYQFFEKQMKEDVDIIMYGKQVETEKSGTTLPFFVYEEGYYDHSQIKDKIWVNMLWDKRYRKSALPHSLCDKIMKKELILRSYNLIENKQHLNIGEDAMILFPMMQWVKSAFVSHKCFYHYRKPLLKTPGYVKDERFFENLFKWYSYLHEQITEVETITEQLDYIYIDLMKARREMWGDLVHNDIYMFPFDKVPANSRIVLYGAGRVGATYYDQISRLNYCDVVAWVDKNLSEKSEMIKPPQIIMEKANEYEYIVVAVQSQHIQNEIINWLIQNNIDKTQIVV